jgi:hypothetical protein
MNRYRYRRQAAIFLAALTLTLTGCGGAAQTSKEPGDTEMQQPRHPGSPFHKPSSEWNATDWSLWVGTKGGG